MAVTIVVMTVAGVTVNSVNALCATVVLECWTGFQIPIYLHFIPHDRNSKVGHTDA